MRRIPYLQWVPSEVAAWVQRAYNLQWKMEFEQVKMRAWDEYGNGKHLVLVHNGDHWRFVSGPGEYGH